MVKSNRLTPLGIERTRPKERDIWLSDDEGTRGGGRLVVRISPSGSKLFYFRYSIDGVRKQLPMLPYSKEPEPDRFTLEQARAKAREYSALHRAPESRDVAAYLQSLRDEAEAQRLALQREEEARAAAEDALKKHTLRALCEAYVTYLEKQEKQSFKNARSLVECHVYGTEHADKPAIALTPKLAAALLRKIVEDGKGRTASKVRSALHSAYSLALRAETDPTAPADLIGFGVEVNPIASTAALSKYNTPRTRTLSTVELRRVLQGLWAEEDPDLSVRAIRLGLLLGGQRALQLLRLEVTDVDLERKTVTLYDPKGRRSTARPHCLPLNKLALSEVQDLLKRAGALSSNWLFASRGSKLDSGAMSTWVTELCKAMLEDGTSLSQFQFSDLRRTAETMMAEMRISKDIRAQIQSHGLSGVQTRHYDMYEYLAEKTKALAAWERKLISIRDGEALPSNIRKLPAPRRA